MLGALCWVLSAASRVLAGCWLRSQQQEPRGTAGSRWPLTFGGSRERCPGLTRAANQRSRLTPLALDPHPGAPGTTSPSLPPSLSYALNTQPTGCCGAHPCCSARGPVPHCVRNHCHSPAQCPDPQQSVDMGSSLPSPGAPTGPGVSSSSLGPLLSLQDCRGTWCWATWEPTSL